MGSREVWQMSTNVSQNQTARTHIPKDGPETRASSVDWVGFYLQTMTSLRTVVTNNDYDDVEYPENLLL
jgi:hypothetical protein